VEPSERPVSNTRPALEIRGGLDENLAEKKRPAEARLDVTARRKAPRPFLISGPASLITPSWNQVVGFLTDWDVLRRMAA
jgi:hypothetical protein